MLCLLDLDAFFCSCEEARRPDLVGVPFCVGGNPDGRGVVATANYAAREFGVGSALPSAEARRRCPQLLFLPVDIAHYRGASRAIWAALADVSPAVEQTGIDEGYLAVPDGADPAGFAAGLQRVVADVAGVTCSVGVARVKVAAKIAADKDRIEARRGKNIAKVAAARKLVTLVYYGLRDGHIRALDRDRAA